jgi:hypothetical protein
MVIKINTKVPHNVCFVYILKLYSKFKNSELKDIIVLSK